MSATSDFRSEPCSVGTGKIDYPAPILNQRLSVEDCLAAVDECGAPVVAIAGGEPLLHNELPKVVEGIIARKKFVYLCTNALLLEKKIGDYRPNPFFSWDVHLDGDREMHDKSVCQTGEGTRLSGQHQLHVVRRCRTWPRCPILR